MKTCPSCQQTYSDDVEFCPRDGAPLPPDSLHRVIPANAGIQTDAQLAAALSRRFRIVRRLGAGAMGTVFLAEQIAVGNRLVALKVLNRKLLDDPDFLLRFQNEAASTGRIHHPNVVTIYESGQADDGTPYIAMEFLEGESLRQALTRRGAFPVPEVAEILQQAARGLNAAHKLGIIHRDLKPDNIFLTHGDDESVAPVSPPANVLVKLVDFGIAKLRESGAHTQTGMVLGTPAYMSFEQASGMRSDELDARSDVYSLGVVTYEMLTGRAPFHSDTPVGYLRMHLQEDPPPFRAVKPDLPALPQLESVVMKALTKDRDQRYSSVLEFARELSSAAQPSPPAQSPVTIPSTRIVPPPALAKPPQFRTAPESRSKMKFVAIAGVALIVIVAGVWYFSQHGSRVGNISSPGRAGESKGEAKVNHKDTITFREEDIIATERVNPKDGLKYMWIPPGSFQMGCSPGDTECDDGEKPPHQVTLTKGFWLGQTEVTVGAYKRFARGTGKAMPKAPSFNPDWSNEQMPIVNVNWADAQAFCAWAGGRLPTDAEWEYAARAGTTQARYGDLDKIAWYNRNSGGQAHAVAQKRANGFGLFDMLGNVWEWVNDWYGENYYQSSPSHDPAGPTSGKLRGLRGGSWFSVPGNIRLSEHSMGLPGADDMKGVRCVGDLSAP
jgi:serine/threonine-protein kinase